MKDNILTDTFQFVSFPKPTPEPKKTMFNYTKKQNKRRRAKLLKKYAPRRPVGVKKGRRRLPSIKSLKFKADRLFSIFVRSRDNDTCVLCHSHKNPQAGHIIKRGKMATRYNPLNVHCLCNVSNYKDNFEPGHYIVWFIHHFGAKTYENLVEKSKQLVKANRSFFEKIINKYG